MDVYTGRVIWEKTSRGLDNYYNVTRHFPSEGEIGSNITTLPDVVYGDTIFQLDAVNGETISEFRFKSDAEDRQPNWGFLAVSGQLLVATSTPVEVAVRTSIDEQKTPPAPNDQIPLMKTSQTQRRFRRRAQLNSILVSQATSCRLSSAHRQESPIRLASCFTDF